MESRTDLSQLLTCSALLHLATHPLAFQASNPMLACDYVLCAVCSDLTKLPHTCCHPLLHSTLLICYLDLLFFAIMSRDLMNSRCTGRHPLMCHFTLTICVFLTAHVPLCVTLPIYVFLTAHVPLCVTLLICVFLIAHVPLCVTLLICVFLIAHVPSCVTLLICVFFIAHVPLCAEI